MDGERRVMAKFGNANEEEIVGIRAPELAPGGNQQFEVNPASIRKCIYIYFNSIPRLPRKTKH